MAQTIAMQRGSTTITTNGSWNTLWTQSTGTATRVILNQLSGYLVYSPVGENNYYATANVSSSGGATVLTSTSVYSSALYGWQVAPIGNASNGSVMSLNPTYYASLGMNANTTGGTPYSIGYSQIAVQSPANYQNSAGQIGQFFMGSGDSFQIRAYSRRSSGKTTISNTLQLYWSFTTITES